MTSGNAGRTSAWIKILAAAAGMTLMASCDSTVAPLRPAWQQDPNLFHRGFAARAAQTTDQPHMVARVIYAEPEQLRRMIDRQGDVADTQRGMARMGDGTVELGVQDAASGKWLESHVCGGILFVAGMPNQAYRLMLKNRTPMALDLKVGVDGRDLQGGSSNGLGRGSLRMEPRGKLELDHASNGPLLFKKVSGDSALFLHSSPKGGTGLIQVGVFLAADAPSLGPEKLRPDQVAPLGFFPVGRPEQYR